MADRTTVRWWAALITFALLTAGCSSSERPQIYGAAKTVDELQASSRSLTTLSPGDTGEEVVVSGTISRVCQTMGCWFYLAEGESLVYVDLEQGARFTVPVDSAGKRAVIAGTYRANGGDARLVAKSAAVWP